MTDEEMEYIRKELGTHLVTHITTKYAAILEDEDMNAAVLVGLSTAVAGVMIGLISRHPSDVAEILDAFHTRVKKEMAGILDETIRIKLRTN